MNQQEQKGAEGVEMKGNLDGDGKGFSSEVIIPSKIDLRHEIKLDVTANEFHMNGKEINILIIDGVKFRIIYRDNKPHGFEKVES